MITPDLKKKKKPSGKSSIVIIASLGETGSEALGEQTLRGVRVLGKGGFSEGPRGCSTTIAHVALLV